MCVCVCGGFYSRNVSFLLAVIAVIGDHIYCQIKTKLTITITLLGKEVGQPWFKFVDGIRITHQYGYRFSFFIIYTVKQ